MKNKIFVFLNKIKNNSIVSFLDTFFYSVLKDRVPRTAGALSYYLILSIFPFLIALLNILNFAPFANQATIIELMAMLPPNITRIINNFISELSDSSSTTLLSISFLGGLWSASRAMRQIVRGVNDAYSFVDERNFFELVVIGIILTIALILLIILIFVSLVFGEYFINILMKYVPLEETTINLIKFLNLLVPVAYMFLMFLILYKFSPSAPEKLDIPLRTIIPGAFFATLTIILGTFIFNIYVQNFSNYSVTYGSLAGIILFLIWLYFFGLVILIGGEINATLYRKWLYGLEWPRQNSIIKKVLANTNNNI